MDSLRVWATTACVAALVCAFCYRLFPDNSLGKQGRLLLPCLFLLALFLPLKGMELSFDSVGGHETQADSAALQSRMKQQTMTYVNDTLLSMANQALSSYDVQVKKITADMNFTADGGIDMGQITVYIDEKSINMAAMIRQVVERRLGTSVMLAQWKEQNE